MFKKKNVRNWIFVILALAVIVPLALRMISPASASTEGVSTQEKVVELDVAQTIEASGALGAQPSAMLTWNTGGVVEDVFVEAGDQVREGDVLMTLRTTTVSASIISAQADLVNARKELDDLLNSSDTELAQAVIALKDAQEAYDKAADYLEYLQTSQKVPQTETRAILQTKRNSWMYFYKTKTFKGPAPEDWIIEAENDLALKTAELEDARYEYDRLKDGPNSDDITAAQAKVDAAQSTVDSMSIIAPFDGQVLYVESQPGSLVNAGESALYAADLARLYVDAQIDESDVANVKVGQPVDVTLDALPGITLTGAVSAINPVGEEVSGLVKYTIRIDLEKAGDEVFTPLGTTANVTIHVSDAAAALAVPITTIQNDASGEFLMLLQSDGTTKRVNVVSGAIVEDLVVVTGDLQAGDRVLVNTASSFSAPNPFGGGGE
jgi:HlyD family secretion protein